jgi:hypothetical protein
MTVPRAGQPGHGLAVSLRRQPVRIVEGHPYWDYAEVSLSLQRIRGPNPTIAAGLAAYDQHLGLTTSGHRS